MPLERAPEAIADSVQLTRAEAPQRPARLSSLVHAVTRAVLSALARLPVLSDAVLHLDAPADPDAALLQACDGDRAVADRYRAVLAKLPDPASATRTWTSIVSSHKAYQGARVHQAALEAIQASTDAMAALEGYAALLAAPTDIERAGQDLTLTLATATKHPDVPSRELFEAMASLRKIDPERNNRRHRWSDLTTALEAVAAAPDRAQANARLIALHVNGRNAAKAVDVDRRIESLTVTPEKRATIRADVLTVLQGCDPYYDPQLIELLDALQGRARVAEEYASFKALGGTPVDLARGVKDLRLLQRLADAHPSIPPSDLQASIQKLRGTAATRAAEDLDAPMAHVVAQKDRAAMVDALLGLQPQGRTVAQALELEKRLEHLGCPSDALRTDLAAHLGKTASYEDATLLDMLDALRGRADGAQGFKAFFDLRGVTDSKRALADLGDLQAEADRHHVPVSEMAEHAVALRTVDPQRNARRKQWCSLREALAHVAASTDRAQSRRLLLELQQNGRNAAQTLEMERRLETLTGTADELAAIRAGVTGLLKASEPYYDKGIVKMLDGLQGRPASPEFAAFQTLRAVTGGIERAADDLALIRQQTAGVSLDECVEHVVAFRKAESRNAENDLAKPLAHVLAQKDAPARAAMTRAIIALQAGGRSAAQALQHETRLEALGTDLRIPYLQLITTAYSGEDAHLLAMLDTLRGRADGKPGFEAFVTLRTLSNAKTAADDLAVTVAAADRHHVPLNEMCEHVVALRAADPQKGKRRPSWCPLADALDHVAGGTRAADRAERRALLLGLQRRERSASVALAFEQRLRRLPDADKIRPGLLELLDANDPYCDKTLLELMDTVRGAEDFAGARRLLAVPGSNLEHAVADLKLVLARTAPPFAEVLPHVVALRTADTSGAALDAPLAHVLAQPDEAARVSMRDDIVALTAGKRTAGQALAHQKGLEGVPADIRASYLALLQKTYNSDESSLLGMLEALKGRSDAPAGLQAFDRVLQATRDSNQALTDLKDALAQATQHTTSLQAAADAVAALREVDPRRSGRRPRFESLAPAAGYALGTPDPAATTKRLVAMHVQGRAAMQAVALDQASPALAVSTRLFEAWTALLGERSSDQDDGLKTLLKAVDTRPNAADELQAARKLVRVAGEPALALQDLHVVQQAADGHPALGLSEVTDCVAGLRKHGGTSAGDLAAAAGLVLDPPDASERTQRFESMQRFMANEKDAPTAAEDLQWILTDVTVGAVTQEKIPTFTERVGQFLALRNFATRGDREGVHHLYDRILANGLEEHQNWFWRLLRRPKTVAGLVNRLLKLDPDAGRASKYLEAVENGRMEGETLKRSFKRFKKLFKYAKGASATTLRDAFTAVRVPPAWDPREAGTRWDELYGLAKQLRSAQDAGALFVAMSTASSQPEADARREAWFGLRQAVGSDCGALYGVVMETLQPGDALDREIAAIQGLHKLQGADLAVRTYRLSRKTGADAGRVRAILGAASNTARQDVLMNRLETPVAGESFTFRATLLEELLRNSKEKAAVADYDATAVALGPAQFEALGQSYAALMSVLRASGNNGATRAKETLAWLQAQYEANPDGSSVSDMLMDLCASMVVRADLDAARTNLLRHEETKRKKRNGQATIQAGEDEVNVGGIKVKVRKTPEPGQ